MSPTSTAAHEVRAAHVCADDLDVDEAAARPGARATHRKEQ